MNTGLRPKKNALMFHRYFLLFGWYLMNQKVWYKEKQQVSADFIFREHASGDSALNGGTPTSSSKRITPTDHQSAVAPTRREVFQDKYAADRHQ